MKLGPGRQLGSTKSVAEARADLERVIEGYRKRQYPDLPQVVPCGWAWDGDPLSGPEAVVTGGMLDDRQCVVSFRSSSVGTVACLYDLSGEMTLPIVDHWLQLDATLSSIGQAEPGLRLLPPVIADTYLEDTARNLFGALSTERLDEVAAKVQMVFVLKSSQVIGARNPREADLFAANHRNLPRGVPTLRKILEDLADSDVAVLPYIQDWPYRVRCLLSR